MLRRRHLVPVAGGGVRQVEMVGASDDVLVIETGGASVAIRLRQNEAAERFKLGCPYSPILLANDIVFEFNGPIIGYEVQEDIRKSAQSRKVFVFDFEPGYLYYSPFVGNAILNFESAKPLDGERGRIIIGDVLESVDGLRHVRPGSKFSVRRPLFSLTVDRAIKPLRSIAESAYGYATVFGTSLTLLGAVDPLIALARWARWLLSHWYFAVDWFWSRLSQLIRLEVPQSLRLYLTIAIFFVYMSVFSSFSGEEDEQSYDDYRNDLAFASLGMLVVAGVLFYGGIAKAGFSDIDKHNVAGLLVVVLGWLAGLAVGNATALKERVWRSIFLFLALITLGAGHDLFARIKSVVFGTT